MTILENTCGRGREHFGNVSGMQTNTKRLPVPRYLTPTARRLQLLCAGCAEVARLRGVR